MTALSLRGMRSGYGDCPVVQGVSVEVPDGGWLAIVGPNGAGKSTVLKTVAGLLAAQGEVLIGGRPRLPRKQLARIVGYAPQDPAIPVGLTVTDYVLLGRTPHLGLLARESRHDLSIVEEVLARLDLAPLAGRRIDLLSGGERQRAVLARVLAQRASLLLLDEPTTGLDLGHAQALLELIDRLRREDGITVVSTLHDLTFAAQYADQLLMLDHGTAVAAGAPAEVLTTEALTRYYGASAEVRETSRGELAVLPVRPGSGANPAGADAPPGGTATSGR